MIDEKKLTALLKHHRKNLKESMAKFDEHSKSFDEKLSKILKSL